MSETPIILSLDASSTAVGWCLAQGRRYIASGCVRPRGSIDSRLDVIVDWMRGMISEHDPDVIAIEEPTGDHGNRRTDRTLARVMGNVEGVCRAMGVHEIKLIHPMSVKATGFSKDHLLASRTLAQKQLSGDEADAIGVWQAYWTSCLSESLMNTGE